MPVSEKQLEEDEKLIYGLVSGDVSIDEVNDWLGAQGDSSGGIADIFIERSISRQERLDYAD